MNLYLIDGTYELFRANFGAPPRTAPDGSPVGAVAGLMQSFLLLLREEKPDFIACAFDHVVESFRNELFGGYKTGEDVPPDLFAQFVLAEDASRALGIVTWPMVEFEADDAIATAVARWKDDPAIERLVVSSVDKDLMNLVDGSRVVLWDRRRGITYSEPDVVERFGVPPSSIPDYLALVGDSADGIPGIPRWGLRERPRRCRSTAVWTPSPTRMTTGPSPFAAARRSPKIWLRTSRRRSCTEHWQLSGRTSQSPKVWTICDGRAFRRRSTWASVTVSASSVSKPRLTSGGDVWGAPPAGLEPTRLAPEASALSTELRGHVNQATNISRGPCLNKVKVASPHSTLAEQLGCGST